MFLPGACAVGYCPTIEALKRISEDNMKTSPGVMKLTVAPWAIVAGVILATKNRLYNPEMKKPRDVSTLPAKRF
jgi:hypothetical protein